MRYEGDEHGLFQDIFGLTPPEGGKATINFS
jgi:hypothetical protein